MSYGRLRVLLEVLERLRHTPEYYASCHEYNLQILWLLKHGYIYAHNPTKTYFPTKYGRQYLRRVLQMAKELT